MNKKQLWLLLVLMAVGFMVAVKGSPAAQEPPLAHPVSGLTTDLSHFNGVLPAGVGGQSTNLSPNSPEAAPDWSKLVYESIRDNHDWDIYTAAPNGGNEVALTSNHNINDIHPRLNQGATRIVFAGEEGEDGDYEIYVMNVDGSGRVQLTHNTTDDVNPDWSPDGSRIVFEAYRDGQPEIYVMNANGGGQSRLTDFSGYDGMPAWAPNNLAIAFVSYRTGGYRIHKMNLNGSNVVQLTTQPYSLYPAWSPDSTVIAFSADSDSNGFLSLWAIHISSLYQWEIYLPSLNTDTWASSWLADGSGVGYTSIHFINIGGTWYWTDAYGHYYNFATHDTASVTNSQTDWAPDWGPTDNEPPQSQVIPLPAGLTRQVGFLLSWSANDVGPAGLGTSDAQYRPTTSSSWIDLITHTTGQATSFRASLSSTPSFYFRSRATDIAGNEEAWSETPDILATFFTWKLFGGISDNRGTMLVNVPLAISPTPIAQTATDRDGRYTAYLRSSAAHSWQASRPGYQTSLTTPATFDRDHSFYLLPANNLLQNSSFEASSQQLTNWTVVGDLPASVTASRPGTGNRAAQIGNSCPEPCLGHALELEGLALVEDSQGNFHWIYDDYGYYHKMQLPNGNWTTPFLITNSTSKIIMVVDSLDNVYAVWGVGNIYYRKRSVSGEWTDVMTVPSCASCSLDSIAASADGNLHFMVKHPGTLQHEYKMLFSSGVWGSSVLIHDQVVSENISVLMATGLDGTVHLTWRGDPINGNTPYLYHAIHYPDGRWATEVIAATYEIPINFLVDHKGNLYFFSTDSMARWTFDQGWFNFEDIPTLYSSSFYQAAVNSQNLIYVCDENGSSVLTCSVYNPQTNNWSNPFTMSLENSDLKTLLVDHNDIIHILTHRSYGSFHNYIKTSLAGSSGATSIQQQVTIPPGMLNPTLSFLYSGQFDAPDVDAPFSVSVISGNTSTTVFTGHLSIFWSLGWADMSPWAGQTITVSFNLEQEADEPMVQLFLDDISLGSAYPDVWVGGQGASVAMPGEVVTYTLNYGNQSGVDVDGAILTLELPAGLTYLSASLPPTSTTPLTWDIGAVPAGATSSPIIITAMVNNNIPIATNLSSTITITHNSTELETSNNSGIIATWVGFRSYLPIASQN